MRLLKPLLHKRLALRFVPVVVHLRIGPTTPKIALARSTAKTLRALTLSDTGPLALIFRRRERVTGFVNGSTGAGGKKQKTYQQENLFHQLLNDFKNRSLA